MYRPSKVTPSQALECRIIENGLAAELDQQVHVIVGSFKRVGIDDSLAARCGSNRSNPTWTTSNEKPLQRQSPDAPRRRRPARSYTLV